MGKLRVDRGREGIGGGDLFDLREMRCACIDGDCVEDCTGVYVNKGRVKMEREREKEKRYNSECICVYMRLCVCVSDYAYDSPMRWGKGGKRTWRSGRVKGMCVVYAAAEFVERL